MCECDLARLANANLWQLQ